MDRGLRTSLRGVQQRCAVYGVVIELILLINLIFAGIASTTITSRITFALSRDEAFPGGRYMAKVNSFTMSPLGSCFLVWVIDNLIISMSFINTQAFYSITGLATIAFQVSYAIPILTRVTIRRNFIFPSNQGFALGWLSFPCGWCGGLWLLITSIFFFWPTTFPVDPSSMNFVVVVVTFIFLVATIYWWAWARNNFKGPPRQKNVATSEQSDNENDMPAK